MCVHGQACTHLPVHGVVPPVADVDCDASIDRLKHRVPSVALHVSLTTSDCQFHSM
jgi:hypothetical protein